MRGVQSLNSLHQSYASNDCARPRVEDMWMSNWTAKSSLVSNEFRLRAPDYCFVAFSRRQMISILQVEFCRANARDPSPLCRGTSKRILTVRLIPCVGFNLEAGDSIAAQLGIEALPAEAKQLRGGGAIVGSPF